MNFYFAVNAVRQFARRSRRPRVVERKTIIFILVPLDSSKFDGTKRASVAQDGIDSSGTSEGEPKQKLFNILASDCSEISGLNGHAVRVDADDPIELDSRLMWTWFLPNPLWKLKRRR